MLLLSKCIPCLWIGDIQPIFKLQPIFFHIFRTEIGGNLQRLAVPCGDPGKGLGQNGAVPTVECNIFIRGPGHWYYRYAGSGSKENSSGLDFARRPLGPVGNNCAVYSLFNTWHHLFQGAQSASGPWSSDRLISLPFKNPCNIFTIFAAAYHGHPLFAPGQVNRKAYSIMPECSNNRAGFDMAVPVVPIVFGYPARRKQKPAENVVDRRDYNKGKPV